jgi:hypothetical protein
MISTQRNGTIAHPPNHFVNNQNNLQGNYYDSNDGNNFGEKSDGHFRGDLGYSSNSEQINSNFDQHSEAGSYVQPLPLITPGSKMTLTDTLPPVVPVTVDLPDECIAEEVLYQQMAALSINTGTFGIPHQSLGVLTKFISTNISLQARIDTIKFFIELAYECHVLRNFMSSTAIFAGLCSQQIHRLTNAWDTLSRRHSDVMVKYEELKANYNSQNNYREHRQYFVMGVGKPQIPHLALVCKDRFACEEVFKDMTKKAKDDGGKFNRAISHDIQYFVHQRLFDFRPFENEISTNDGNFAEKKVTDQNGNKSGDNFAEKNTILENDPIDPLNQTFISSSSSPKQSYKPESHGNIASIRPNSMSSRNIAYNSSHNSSHNPNSSQNSKNNPNSTPHLSIENDDGTTSLPTQSSTSPRFGPVKQQNPNHFPPPKSPHKSALSISSTDSIKTHSTTLTTTPHASYMQPSIANVDIMSAISPRNPPKVYRNSSLTRGSTGFISPNFGPNVAPTHNPGRFWGLSVRGSSIKPDFGPPLQNQNPSHSQGLMTYQVSPSQGGMGVGNRSSTFSPQIGVGASGDIPALVLEPLALRTQYSSGHGTALSGRIGGNCQDCINCMNCNGENDENNENCENDENNEKNKQNCSQCSNCQNCQTTPFPLSCSNSISPHINHSTSGEGSLGHNSGGDPNNTTLAALSTLSPQEQEDYYITAETIHLALLSHSTDIMSLFNIGSYTLFSKYISHYRALNIITRCQTQPYLLPITVYMPFNTDTSCININEWWDLLLRQCTPVSPQMEIINGDGKVVYESSGNGIKPELTKNIAQNIIEFSTFLSKIFVNVLKVDTQFLTQNYEPNINNVSLLASFCVRHFASIPFKQLHDEDLWSLSHLIQNSTNTVFEQQDE